MLSCKNKVLSFQNSCITTKLRDFLYVVLNHPSQYCRERPRMILLKRKIQNLYSIITRVCYRVRTSETSALSFILRFLFFRPKQLFHAYMSVFCWQDLVFFTDDCEAIDTGHVRPYYAEDRLQLLQEERWTTRTANNRLIIGLLHW